MNQHQTESIDEYVGGKKLQHIARSQNPEKRDLYQRFAHYQIPVGLPLNRGYMIHYENTIATEPIDEKKETGNREQHLTYQMVDNRKFDDLFYSVGKDLGNPNLKNKTKKRERK
jgi:hypothetical protein